MVKASVSSAVLFVATVGLTGCHDPLTVDPYPQHWLIDDFESHNGVPFDPSFEHWGCRPSEPLPNYKCEITPDPDLDPGGRHGWVLHLGATLYPMAHGDTFTRSQVATYVPGARLLDLTPYSSLSLSWKLTLDKKATDPSFSLKVELSCTTARNGDAGVPDKPFVLFHFDFHLSELDQNWHEDSLLPISEFHSPEQGGNSNADWERECVSHVDGIRITLDSNANVQYGDTVEFNLYVDNIELAPNVPR
jgi:hypothetical protein